jgi:hypothetical protein
MAGRFLSLFGGLGRLGTLGALIWLLLAAPGAAGAEPAAADALRARFAALRASGSATVLDRAVYLQSREQSEQMHGEVYAVVDRPFAELRSELARAAPWCGILILHLNVKYCRATSGAAGEVLVAGVGRKFDQPLDGVHWARFAFSAPGAGEDFLHVELSAPTGPMSTYDYRISVESVPLAAGQTLLHMRYSWSFGLAAKWAMDVYLSTVGRGKAGLAVVGRKPDGQPVYSSGMRGVIERNTLRYYLAIDAYLASRALPPAERFPRSLQLWFNGTERYAEQLHEIDRDEYMAMKLREAQRQETVPPPPPPSR